MQVTNGTVEFERVTRPADFESKRGKVVLSFTIDEGEDAEAVVGRVGEIAIARALSMVGEKPVQAPPREVVAKAPKPPVVVAQEPTAAATPPAEADTASGSSAPVEADPAQPESAPAPITDQQITDAINAALGKGVQGPDIRKTVDRVVGIVGASVYSLGNEKRQEAVDAIAALVKPQAAPLTADEIKY